LKKRTKKLLVFRVLLQQRAPLGAKVFASFFKKKCFLPVTMSISESAVRRSDASHPGRLNRGDRRCV
jgi:hypothetical protein